MATDIVTDPPAQPEAGEVPAEVAQPPKYTPEDHTKASALKVVRLVELGANKNGKTATFEFTGGFVRSVDVDEKTIWHSLFAEVQGVSWRQLVEHVAVRSKRVDGTQLEQIGPMPFWTRLRTARGREFVTNYFDVPDEKSWAGQLTGAKAARELILFLKQYERAREVRLFGGLESEISACLRRASTLASRGADAHKEAGPHHAAKEFCTLVTRYFMTGAGNANPAYLDDQVTRAEGYLAWTDKRDEERRLEFAERMRTVRAAKAAKGVGVTVAEEAGMSTQRRRVKTSEGAANNGHTLQ